MDYAEGEIIVDKNTGFQRVALYVGILGVRTAGMLAPYPRMTSTPAYLKRAYKRVVK